MNTKVIYALAGGITAIVIVLFFIMELGNIQPFGNNAAPSTSETQIADLQLGLRDIIVEKTNEDDANVQVVFDVHNPNRSTAILETIHYTLNVGQYQMTTGDIGVNPEGFVSGQ
ncbi:MAG: hypothetical protein ACJ703_08680, partial [Nitrososphaera sp.]